MAVDPVASTRLRVQAIGQNGSMGNQAWQHANQQVNKAQSDALAEFGGTAEFLNVPDAANRELSGLMNRHMTPYSTDVGAGTALQSDSAGYQQRAVGSLQAEVDKQLSRMKQERDLRRELSETQRLAAEAASRRSTSQAEATLRDIFDPPGAGGLTQSQTKGILYTEGMEGRAAAAEQEIDPAKAEAYAKKKAAQEDTRIHEGYFRNLDRQIGAEASAEQAARKKAAAERLGDAWSTPQTGVQMNPMDWVRNIRGVTGNRDTLRLNPADWAHAGTVGDHATGIPMAMPQAVVPEYRESFEDYAQRTGTLSFEEQVARRQQEALQAEQMRQEQARNAYLNDLGAFQDHALDAAVNKYGMDPVMTNGLIRGDWFDEGWDVGRAQDQIAAANLAEFGDPGGQAAVVGDYLDSLTAEQEATHLAYAADKGLDQLEFMQWMNETPMSLGEVDQVAADILAVADVPEPYAVSLATSEDWQLAQELYAQAQANPDGANDAAAFQSGLEASGMDPADVAVLVAYYYPEG